MVCPNCNTESGPSLFCYVCDAYLPSISEGVKASIPSRLGAFLLDAFVFLALLLVIGVIAYSAGVHVGSSYEDYDPETLLKVLSTAALGYFLSLLWLLARGQTPGKWLMDIRAVDKRNGSEPGLGRMLLRETFGKWVSGCFLGLGWFWAIWDRDAQAWHDKIVRTVVLYRRAQTSKYPFLLLLFSAPVLSVGFLWAVVVHNRPPNVQSIATEQAFSPDFNEGTALSALFGNYDSVEKSSSVTVVGRFDSLSHAGKLTLILDSPFSQGGVQKHLLVTSTTVEGEDCHACGARIGAYLFANRAGRWTPEIADKEVDQFGAFGHAFGMSDRDHPNGNDGEVQAVKLGPDLHGFSLTITDAHQGVEDTSELFVGPVESHYQPVLSLNIEEGNAGNCGPAAIIPAPCYGYKSTVRLLNSAHAGYFDIKVDQAGTEYSDQGIIPANHKRLYFFLSDKYVEQGSDNAASIREAAEQGDALAQTNLGGLYYLGQGVPRDYTQAVYWYRKAAEQGNAHAQGNLGGLYANGQGVPQDYTQAVYWYGKAAEQGDASAQYNFGVLYKSGLGVSQDYAQAATWFRKAAEQGNALAQDHLGNLYFSGEGVPQGYTQAVYWCRKAAEQGDAKAQYDLGSLYYLGNGGPQDYAQAYFWIALAASGEIEGVKQEDVDKLRDEVTSHLTPAELSQVQERVRKWPEQHPPKVE